MKSKIQKTGNTIEIELGGNINYEAQDSLKQDLSKIMRNATALTAAGTSPNVVINMLELKFVGSSHISMFVQAIKDFQSRSPVKARIINVSSEFKKIFKAYDETSLLDFLDSESGDKGNTRFDQ
ncbi:MAG: anti-sigma factor antagonist [Xanthomonadaceae bacterium]|nr:anti-sigma factor antagonist [Xanthomonadaceae bacterium]